jgi:hypothetical protein
MRCEALKGCREGETIIERKQFMQKRGTGAPVTKHENRVVSMLVARSPRPYIPDCNSPKNELLAVVNVAETATGQRENLTRKP